MQLEIWMWHHFHWWSLAIIATLMYTLGFSKGIAESIIKSVKGKS